MEIFHVCLRRLSRLAFDVLLFGEIIKLTSFKAKVAGEQRIGSTHIPEPFKYAISL